MGFDLSIGLIRYKFSRKSPCWSSSSIVDSQTIGATSAHSGRDSGVCDLQNLVGSEKYKYCSETDELPTQGQPTQEKLA